MSLPRLTVTERGNVALEGFNTLLALMLQEVPSILEDRHAPAPRQRLFPPPTESDAEWNETWQYLVTPELESLFQSAAETMARDLAAMQSEDTEDETIFRVEIPAAHVNAWISALNQARLILGAKHQVTERDMNSELPLSVRHGRSAAIIKIRMLGYLLELFVELQLDDQ